MEGKTNYQVIKTFGPSIFKTKIPEYILDNLNEYTDKLLKDQEAQRKYDHGNNLAGDVTQEFMLSNEIIKNSGWLEFLSTCTKKWVEIETGKEIKKFNLIKSWIVRQFENEYNPTHCHGGHISGAGFLKVPKNFGEYKQKKINKKNPGGHLQLIHGSRMFLCDSTLTLKPEIGDFYFFPNYLMHTVFPFKNSNEERRSISFNAFIDENIYDVYGNY
mgnify:CR=1 FL=1|tara:strand:+ start:156 stop:803 length:648 start_codon:yes stop_codon:yes gene_type:complete